MYLQDGAEFAKMYNGYRMQPDRQPGKTFNPPPLTDLPTTVDWRPKGYVTAIKNQVWDHITVVMVM